MSGLTLYWMAHHTPPRPVVAPARLIRFSDLWSNYPNNDPCVNPRTGKPAYDDQCAIRLGMTLQKSGVNFKSFTGPVCQFGPPGNGMVLRAQELADWLMKRPFSNCPPPVAWAPGKGFADHFRGRTGIIFFQHYWLRTGEKPNGSAPYGTGNHIDLWRIDRLTPSWETRLRFSIGINSIHVPLLPQGHDGFSDLNNSTRVLLWPIL